MGELYNPLKIGKPSYKTPSSKNTNVGDVYLYREPWGDIISFCVKKVNQNSFAAQRIKE